MLERLLVNILAAIIAPPLIVLAVVCVVGVVTAVAMSDWIKKVSKDGFREKAG